jgi:hypothetical protein
VATVGLCLGFNGDSGFGFGIQRCRQWVYSGSDRWFGFCGGFGFGFRRRRSAVGFGFDGGGFGFAVGFSLNGGGFGSAMGLGLRWVSALMVGGLVCGGFSGSFDGGFDFVVVLWL